MENDHDPSSENRAVFVARHPFQQAGAEPVQRPADQGRRLDRGVGGGYQPELGAPWFRLGHFPVYAPPAFFWWWYAFDAYAREIFYEGAVIAASGGLIAIPVAIAMSVWRAREAREVTT
jgi:hypothetical protein